MSDNNSDLTHGLTDCGDHSCIFRDPSKPSGMRTQGGCQHLKLDHLETRRLFRAMAQEIVRLRKMTQETCK